MTPLKRQLNGTTILTRDPITIGTAILGSTLTAATTVGGYALGAAIVGYVVTTAVTSFIMAALAPKPEIPESQGLLVNVRDGVAPHEFVYGQVRKGGTITYVETTGDKNKLLHQMIAVAGHKVEEIGDIYLNDEVVSITDDTGYKPNGTDVALAGPGWVTTTKWTSKNRINSSSNPYEGQEIRWPRIRLLKHDGSQTAVTNTFAGSSTATLSNTFLTETDNFGGAGQPTSASYVGNNIAYIYARLAFNEKVFANGVPLITAVVKGKKVYDPRTGTTAYSNNAALVIRDYLTSAYGLSDDQIDDTYFSAAANICDENVALDGGGTEKRYTINGVIRASTSHQEVLTKMMSACGGTLFWGGGKWKLIVGDYVAPTKTLTLDDLRGPITLDTKLNLRDQFNSVQGTFNSAVDDWITTDYPAITSATFRAQDGGQEAPLDLPLPFTTSSASAQRLAKQTLFRAREQMTFSAEFGLNALDVEVGEIISLDIDRYGWSGKEFEVVGWALRPNQQAGDLRVALTLRETSEAAFDWNAEETEIIANDTTLPDFTVVPTVTGLTVSNGGGIQADGTTLTTALISWDAAGDPVEYYEVLYKPLTTEVSAGSFVIGDEYRIKTVGTTDFTAIGAVSNTAGVFFRATGVGSGTGVAYDAENNFSFVTTNSGDNLIASGVNNVEIGPLIGGTLYYVKVRAIDSFGNIAEDFTTTTFTAGQDTVAPGVPTSLSATGRFGFIDLEWTNPVDPDFSHALIYESDDSNFSNATNIGRSGSSNFIRGNLAPLTTKYYWVSSVDYTGNESAKTGPVFASTAQVGIGDIQEAVIPYSALDTSVTNVFDDVLGDITQLQTDLTSAEGDITGNATAISGLDTRVTSAEGSITTQASQITSLTTSVNSNTTSVTQLATSIAGIEAQYSVEIDNNGNITGYQLISDATQRSAFNVRADQFNVFSTDGTISNSVFTVLTAPTTLPNGTVVPAGAYVDKIFVQDLSAQAATIGTFQSAASGARLVISDDKLEVYDSNNVLRVRIGNLA